LFDVAKDLALRTSGNQYLSPEKGDVFSEESNPLQHRTVPEAMIF
jgi:hypothetical protein